MSFAVSSHAFQCRKTFALGKIELEIKKNQKLQQDVKIQPTLIKPQTLETFTKVFNLYDPSVIEQESFPPELEDLFNQSFIDDVTLNQLEPETKERVKRLLSKQIIEPDYAIEVALYLEGYDFIPRQEKAVEDFINLKVRAEVLKEIKSFLSRNWISSKFVKEIGSSDLIAIGRFLSNPTHVLSFNEAPRNERGIDRINSLYRVESSIVAIYLREAYQRIILTSGFSLSLPLQK